MKKLLGFFAMLAIVLLTSCEGVESGHRGVEVSWGGKTNMDVIHGEGINVNINWLWNKMIPYDVREKTITQKFSFNDTMNMVTPVELSIDYRLDPTKVNVIHSTIGQDQLDIKIITTLSSAAKQVIPQFTASALNLTKREDAEKQIFAILENEFPQFYVSCSRVRITDVDIPRAISDAAEATARQAELNKLSQSKVQDSKNLLEAAKYDAEAKAILSKPEMLALKQLEVDMEYAKKGISKYGNNNVFGAGMNLLKTIN